MAIVPVEEVVILKKLLQKETLIRNATEGELNHLKSQMEELKMWEVCFCAPTFVLFTLHVPVYVTSELVLHVYVYICLLK